MALASNTKEFRRETASELPISAIPGLTSTDVQSALAEILTIAASAMNYMGGHDASGGAFPTAGSADGGGVAIGDVYTITVAGTIGGVAYEVGDELIATADAPTAADWQPLQNRKLSVSEDATLVDANVISLDFGAGLVATSPAAGQVLVEAGKIATLETAAFTAQKEALHFVDTTGGPVAITAPAAPAIGCQFTVYPANGADFSANNVTFGTHTIDELSTGAKFTYDGTAWSAEFLGHEA